ncbi:small secreted hydrophilic protein [Streptomyces sp. NPDC059578]|uniref:small secreted hydrophilic protein n=1 Tax=unclassified Streptomyces TaxID=2593676 RepID=UPI00364C7D0B
MVFTHRIAALAAVVAIPLGIAVTSYALTDTPDDRKVPTKVELESGSPSGSPGAPQTPGSPRPEPTDETVSPPPVGEAPTGTTPSTGPSAGPSTSASTSPSASASTSSSPSGDDDDGPGQDDDGPGGDDNGDDG